MINSNQLKLKNVLNKIKFKKPQRKLTMITVDNFTCFEHHCIDVCCMLNCAAGAMLVDQEEHKHKQEQPILLAVIF